MPPAPDATSPASQVEMSEANETLVERLERRTLQRSFCDEKDLVNPDGPEAAKAIRDLEAENARLRSAPIPAVQSGAVATELTEFQRIVSEQDLAEPYWQGYRDALNLVASQGLAAPQSEPLPGGVGEADYAAIGRGLVNAIEAAAAEYPWVRSWSPAERYDEIVGDLLDLAFPDTPVQSAVAEIRALETRTRPVDVVAAFLKERDDAVGTLDADDEERMESAQRILAALSGKEQG